MFIFTVSRFTNMKYIKLIYHKFYKNQETKQKKTEIFQKNNILNKNIKHNALQLRTYP